MADDNDNRHSNFKYNVLSKSIKKSIQSLEYDYEEALIFKKGLDKCKLPVGLISLDNIFIWVNPAFCIMLGYSEDELIGHNWLDFTSEESKKQDLELLAKGEPYLILKKYVHKTGRLIPVFLSATKIDCIDTPLHIAIVYEVLVLQEALCSPILET